MRRSLDVVLCDDHNLFTDVLGELLRKAGHRVVGVADSPERLLALVRSTHVDVCVLDLGFPSGDVVAAVASLAEGQPDLAIVVLTGAGQPDLERKVCEAGAWGSLTKGVRSEVLLQALHDATSGRRQAPVGNVRTDETRCRPLAARSLTDRELEVLHGLVAGRSTQQLAESLGLRTSTVRGYVQTVLLKCGVNSRVAAVAFAVRHGLVTTRAPR